MVFPSLDAARLTDKEPRDRIPVDRNALSREFNQDHTTSNTRREKYMRFGTIALALVIPLAGCGAMTKSSGPVPLGPDTWRIAVRDGFNGGSASQAMAIKEANNHCVSLGKNIMVVGVNDTGDAGNVTYRCLRTGDPELVRPNLKKTPDTVIQVGS